MEAGNFLTINQFDLMLLRNLVTDYMRSLEEKVYEKRKKNSNKPVISLFNKGFSGVGRLTS